MEYQGNYSELIYELVNQLEDAATVPALNGGYPSVAILEEWQKARKHLDFLYEVGLLNRRDLDDANALLAGTADEYLTKYQEDFENCI